MTDRLLTNDCVDPPLLQLEGARRGAGNVRFNLLLENYRLRWVGHRKAIDSEI